MKNNDCIYIDKDAYFFLRRESRKQRGWPTMNQAEEDEIWDRINKVDNKRLVTSDSFGGGDGTSTGAWWPWSLDDMKDMLDKAGLQYS